MRPHLEVTRLAAGLLALCLAFSPSPSLCDEPAARRQPPAPSAVRAMPTDPAGTLELGLDLERKRNWSGAMALYEESIELWPERSDFVQRRRLCEIHHKLVRRYSDQSFRKVLLTRSREESLELLDEVVERIETHYVETVAFEGLLRRGYDNMEVALREPTFLVPNAPKAKTDQVALLRQQLLGRRDRLNIPNRQAALAEVDAVCSLSRQALNLSPASVTLEFVYGTCDALDDYTSCLTPDKLDDLYAMIDGNFVGLGVELKGDAQGILLVGVIKKGPASEAGLKVGDRIIAIAGKSIRGVSLDDAAGRLQGTEGTAIDLSIQAKDGSTRQVRLVRRPVEVESVGEAKLLGGNSSIGYLQLSGFQKTSTDELDRGIASLQSKGMRYLILDLRGNPGGLLNVAVEIAERFIDQGVIVSTKGRAKGQTATYRASGRAIWTMPMAVLIDRDSASASEILAGALKEHQRALIIGERSYGKGSVQSIFSLHTVQAGLKLTTAKFYSPTDRAYSEQGVDPDVPVRLAAKPVDGESTVGVSSDNMGDPDRDAVLAQAIAQARRRLSQPR